MYSYTLPDIAYLAIWEWLTVQTSENVRSLSWAARAARPKIEVIRRHVKARERRCEVYIAYLADMGMTDYAKTGENARPKIEVIWRHRRARERWFVVCKAIL